MSSTWRVALTCDYFLVFGANSVLVYLRSRMLLVMAARA